MRRIFMILIAVLGSGVAFSQKTIHDANAEKRSVGDFHGIHVSTGVELVLTPGATEEIAVSAATAEFRDRIVTRVEGGILYIEYDNKIQAPNTRKQKKDLRAYVSYTTLDVLNAHTGAGVRIEGVLKSPSLKMEVHTGARVKGEVDIEDLSVEQGTGSDITFTGKAEKLKAEGHTGSMFHGIDLLSSQCDVTASTGAGIFITVSRELNVKANTGGYVKYKGEAGIREIKTNSGGSVKRI